MLRVKLFARAKQLVGHDVVTMSWSDGGTVAALKEALCQSYPNLRPLAPQLLFAVNNEYASDDFMLKSTDEVACFPPVSGG